MIVDTLSTVTYSNGFNVHVYLFLTLWYHVLFKELIMNLVI